VILKQIKIIIIQDLSVRKVSFSDEPIINNPLENVRLSEVSDTGNEYSWK